MVAYEGRIMPGSALINYEVRYPIEKSSRRVFNPAGEMSSLCGAVNGAHRRVVATRRKAIT